MSDDKKTEKKIASYGKNIKVWLDEIERNQKKLQAEENEKKQEKLKKKIENNKESLKKTVEGTASLFLKIMVRGPGQNFSAIFLAFSGISLTIRSRLSISAIWMISGLSEGLPFAAYIFSEDSAFSPSPPSPYTVSVGNATRPPFFRISPACLITDSSGCSLSTANIMVFTFSLFFLSVLYIHNHNTIVSMVFPQFFYSR